jgi:C-terminal processing protease CtpA/Prc
MCTVGLMLSGCTIEDTMPGSPSFLNGQIKGGDVIELVDNKSVSLDTLVDLIRGADRTGS